MKTISIRELHNRTGHYIRRAATEPLTVTDRGETIARIVPIEEVPVSPRFADRRLSPGFKHLQKLSFHSMDSGKLISEDRDRS